MCSVLKMIKLVTVGLASVCISAGAHFQPHAEHCSGVDSLALPTADLYDSAYRYYASVCVREPQPSFPLLTGEFLEEAIVWEDSRQRNVVVVATSVRGEGVKLENVTSIRCYSIRNMNPIALDEKLDTSMEWRVDYIIEGQYNYYQYVPRTLSACDFDGDGVREVFCVLWHEYRDNGETVVFFNHGESGLRNSFLWQMDDLEQMNNMYADRLRLILIECIKESRTDCLDHDE